MSSDREPSTSANNPLHSGPMESNESSGRWNWRRHWAPYVLPLLVYMLSGQLEPAAVADQRDTPPEAAERNSDPFADDRQDALPDAGPAPAEERASYPLIYALRIALTVVAMALAWPAYRQFPLRIGWMAPAVGAAGAVIWIGLATLQREALPPPEPVAQWLGGGRAAYDPLTNLRGQPLALAGFLAVRLLGLALVVPVIEEFFLRGFLMRFVTQPDWWNAAIGGVSAAAIAAMLAYALLTHPNEALAALAWFSLVTWLAARTKNIWDAVAAHAATNLLLGAWVLASRQWWLW